MALSRLPVVPASFFGIVLGIGGLGNAWRAAHQVWQLPAWIGETLLALAAVVWLTLLVLTSAKWIYARPAALAELSHPVQSCFVGLAGLTTMVMAGAVLPYSRDAALVLFVLGFLHTVSFAVWLTGTLWVGGRDKACTTAALYLPVVGGSFVAAAVAANLGYADWGELAFGAGAFTWLAIDAVLLHRLYTADAMAPMIRPTLGIQLAPPTVGAIAYINLSSGPPDLFIHAMLAYGLMIAVVLLRLLPWIREQPFSVSYWGFTFGVTSLTAAPLRLIQHGETGPFALMAPYLFVGGNLVILVMTVATIRLLVQGKLVSPK
ncbi:dicarboxylate transporter/tellurite-resistance protein TehA [Dyella japonica]|uniref:Tellurite resistance protein TehA n=1 Tax=Dyella japonica DSM 16301 TaxID=1440762 RepID=A0A0G9H0V8_9GAMM|nr:dicarboxylate transporter/tellurite-resistance protein TehA [Dyella japonica]KLD62844.1 tellurite resistance protein TehA [Dyella japonica DSM 16301]